MTQPSASQRLAAIERSCGVRLFERDTRGARPTPAGREMAAQARHILGHVEAVFGRARDAAQSESLAVGTFSSLAMLVFPPLQAGLPQVRISQVADHAPALVDWVAEGSLDAAFIAIAGQIRLPPGVTSLPIGSDRLVTLVPPGCDFSWRRRASVPARPVLTYTIDNSGDDLDRRLVALGTAPQHAATAETAVRMARRLAAPVVLPGCLAKAYVQRGDRLANSPVPGGPILSMVTRPPVHPGLRRLLPQLRVELGLHRHTRD